MAVQSRPARLIPMVAEFRAYRIGSEPKTFKEWLTMNGKEAAGASSEETDAPAWKPRRLR